MSVVTGLHNAGPCLNVVDMANNTKRVKVFRVLGTTDDVTTCDQCGRDDLKGTVVLAALDGEGNDDGETYMGSDCAARATGWTQKRIRDEVKAAEKAKREAERAAREAACDARTAQETAEMIEWAAEVYGIHATTRAELFEAVRVASGRRGPASALILFREYKERQAEEAATEAAEETTETPQEGTVKNWTNMTRGDFYTAGTQLDMLAGIEGDGCGTIPLDELAAEIKTAPVVDFPERADGALFGLALSEEIPADGALFSVVAA